MNKKLIWIACIILVIQAMIFAGGQKETDSMAAEKTGPVHNEYRGATYARYVFLFVGDGMGLPQVGAAEIYAGSLKDSAYPEAPRSLVFTAFPAQGITTTHDASSFITDSASAGTAFACGHKTLTGVISMDVEKRIRYKSIASYAKQQNMKVGIVSSVSIDHATPAVFYANQPSRSNMYEIALNLADSGFDYFAGGSIVDPDGTKSTMENKPGNAFAYARSRGYRIVTTKEDILGLGRGSGKVWAITEKPADASAMLYEVDRKSELSLADFTAKGIELLDNPNGFFMMVEGGKIDWACHANDGLSAIKDVFAFDDAVKTAVKFAEAHPAETLIVVTGDHECGGMTIGFAGTGYDTFFRKLQGQELSFQMFNDVVAGLKENTPKAEFSAVLPYITRYFGLTANGDGSALDLTEYEIRLLKDAFAETMKESDSRSAGEESKILYGGYEPLTVTITHILNRKAGIGWTTYSHTGVPVPTYASGTGEDLFNGYYDNTDIFYKLAAVMNIKTG